MLTYTVIVVCVFVLLMVFLGRRKVPFVKRVRCPEGEHVWKFHKSCGPYRALDEYRCKKCGIYRINDDFT